jgi:hypothetical protein
MCCDVRNIQYIEEKKHLLGSKNQLMYTDIILQRTHVFSRLVFSDICF